MAKFYVVWKGRKSGIYTDWNSCKAQVDGFAGARYKSFKTEAEAKAAFGSAPTSAGKGATVSSKVVKKPAKLNEAQIKCQMVDAPLAIFCDGACDPNPGKAGTGIAVYQFGKLTECWYGLYNPNGTNNTAELLGLHYALKMVQLAQGDEPALIYSDSSYSINAVTQWAKGWKAKGWKRGGNEPVKNLEIIQPLYELYLEVADRVVIRHVAGHAGIEGNELADRMSVVAVTEREPQLKQYQHPLDIDAILALARG
ncbi:ribonuclease H family protein [Ferrimonas lipolytica]|uniref:Ribonuclease H n=1 Tax=Ferrimonas lipolytica TaxID=2724191 RepID=A0A6H1UCB4_9GAMM|nr:ribonuclease H family protein [Ferrimonas lipolytica]QIZ76701.1 ribonuclease HI [Ferrimonas lipolytica]